MTRFDINGFMRTLLTGANNTKNDYTYHSGWNPAGVLGQQFKLSKAEAVKLVASIDKQAWFIDPMLSTQTKVDVRAAVLGRLHQVQTPEFAKQNSKGSVLLTGPAAKIFNDYAAKLGATLKFSSDQPRPSHPIG